MFLWKRSPTVRTFIKAVGTWWNCSKQQSEKMQRLSCLGWTTSFPKADHGQQTFFPVREQQGWKKAQIIYPSLFLNDCAQQEQSVRLLYPAVAFPNLHVEDLPLPQQKEQQAVTGANIWLGLLNRSPHHYHYQLQSWNNHSSMLGRKSTTPGISPNTIKKKYNICCSMMCLSS